MHALRVGEDAAVANRTVGAEDAVQRVRSPFQVGQAGAGVQAGGESDLRVDSTLELSPESNGAQAAEGDAPARTAGGGAAASPPPPAAAALPPPTQLRGLLTSSLHTCQDHSSYLLIISHHVFDTSMYYTLFLSLPCYLIEKLFLIFFHFLFNFKSFNYHGVLERKNF
ncbi:unnamed protein product [Camellia sinensis]